MLFLNTAAILTANTRLLFFKTALKDRTTPHRVHHTCDLWILVRLQSDYDFLLSLCNVLNNTIFIMDVIINLFETNIEVIYKMIYHVISYYYDREDRQEYN